jgi:peptidoglycan/xylan/chitin deacetylase (PgdA/CDA1 family)
LIARSEKVAAQILWATGVAALARRLLAARGRFVIELHGVPRRRYPELPVGMQPSLAAPDLERVLIWMLRRFRFLSADEFLKSDTPGVLLTFDDGFANNHDVVLPLLEKFRTPAVFFITTQHIGKGGQWLAFVEEAAVAGWGDSSAVPHEAAHDLFDGMDEQQIRACADSGLVTIGAHSVSHPRLTEVDVRQLSSEVGESRAALERMIEGPVDLFAYPFGDVDARVAEAVRDAGYRAAFVEEPWQGLPTHLGIPRIGLHRADPWYLAAKLSGLHDRPIHHVPLAV